MIKKEPQGQEKEQMDMPSSLPPNFKREESTMSNFLLNKTPSITPASINPMGRNPMNSFPIHPGLMMGPGATRSPMPIPMTP